MTTFKNLCLLSDKYAVAPTEQDTLVKSTTKIFSNLWPSQKTQYLPRWCRTKKLFMYI